MSTGVLTSVVSASRKIRSWASCATPLVAVALGSALPTPNSPIATYAGCVPGGPVGRARHDELLAELVVRLRGAELAAGRQRHDAGVGEVPAVARRAHRLGPVDLRAERVVGRRRVRARNAHRIAGRRVDRRGLVVDAEA